MNKQRALDKLEEIGIKYDIMEHEPVYTIEEMDNLGITEKEHVAKNLFLRDAKGKNHYLVVIDKDKRADLVKIASELGSTKLSFASEERLKKYLGLEKGAVTPLGVVNDEGDSVIVAVDSDLKGCDRIGVHPNVNTATVWVSFDDLKKYVEACGNDFMLIDM